MLLAALVVLLAAGPLLPRWAMFMLNVSLSWGTVVLGMLLLMRTGLVSFGQGLYYCLGAYAAGALHHFYGIADIMVMLLASLALAAAVATVLGLLLAKYRGIFFAMLSLALSMILFGLLVKTSALGSTTTSAIFRRDPGRAHFGRRWERYALFARPCGRLLRRLRRASPVFASAVRSIRDNELRVEQWALVARVIHVNYDRRVVAGIGGGLVGINIGHVDPEMRSGPSGEFVFIAICRAPEVCPRRFWAPSSRELRLQYSPNTWHLIPASPCCW